MTLNKISIDDIAASCVFAYSWRILGKAGGLKDFADEIAGYCPLASCRCILGKVGGSEDGDR